MGSNGHKFISWIQASSKPAWDPWKLFGRNIPRTRLRTGSWQTHSLCVIQHASCIGNGIWAILQIADFEQKIQWFNFLYFLYSILWKPLKTRTLEDDLCDLRDEYIHSRGSETSPWPWSPFCHSVPALRPFVSFHAWRRGPAYRTWRVGLICY